jgi:hypothetical protein
MLAGKVPGTVSKGVREIFPGLSNRSLSGPKTAKAVVRVVLKPQPGRDNSEAHVRQWRSVKVADDVAPGRDPHRCFP